MGRFPLKGWQNIDSNLITMELHEDYSIEKLHHVAKTIACFQ